jgi:hypothetical protein
MTDDNNSRYRSSDPYGAPPAGQSASDPLAELARLIGKNDPFAELGRTSQHAAAPQPTSDPFRSAAIAEPRTGRQHSDHDGGHSRFDDAVSAKPFPPVSGGWEATAQPAPDYDPFAPHSPPPPLSPAQRYEDHPYASGAHGAGHGQPIVDTYRPDFDQANDPLHQTHAGHHNENVARVDDLRMGDIPGFGPPPFHPAESGAPEAADEQFYDDAPPRRRKGLVTVAAVLALAVLGTAAAFGYRSYVAGGGSSTSVATVIRAPSEPSKVAPPAPQQSADASKISYDRFGDRGQNERLVSREEQPLDQREIARSSAAPRTVLPGAPVATPNAPASSQSNAPSALGEPKRIRTVPIRPDQADASASAGSSVVPKQQQVAAFPPPPTSQSLQQSAPPQAPLDTSPAAQRQAVPPAPRAQRPPTAPSSNAPLSLAPDANNAPAPVASAPAPRAPAQTQMASAPANGGTGRYHVQVASQRSEADAQTAFRSVQGKYSSVLGGQPHTIRRVELGEKGTYYRAMVGPFATREQAVQLCTSLKSAGGDCVVQSN